MVPRAVGSALATLIDPHAKRRPVMIPRISIVIPCCCDALALAATLDHLAGLERACDVEVIVSASGDELRTRDVVRGRARLMWPASSTRAELLNAGAEVGRAPILLFLHADSLLPARAVSQIERALCSRDVDVLQGASLPLASTSERTNADRAWIGVVSTVGECPDGCSLCSASVIKSALMVCNSTIVPLVRLTGHNRIPFATERGIAQQLDICAPRRQYAPWSALQSQAEISGASRAARA
jgi:hypothetical protein